MRRLSVLRLSEVISLLESVCRLCLFTRMKGDIAELMIYITALSALQRNQVVNFLASKYGLTHEIAAQPRLTLYSSATNLGLSWPIWAQSFKLESAGKSLPLDWEPVADEPVIVGDQVTLRLPLSEQLRFYRLRRL